MRAMRESDRRARLVEHLRVDGRASVAQLASSLDVTPSTIRRDLQRLAGDGRLVRTYGGAALNDGLSRVARADPRLAAKQAIARAAAGLAADGSTIAIGSGTTALALAREIADRRLTVITNALDVAWTLVDEPGIELIVLGGAVRPRMHSMLGHLTEMATRELRADILFIGIGGISLEHGLMNDWVPEIVSDRALRRTARRCVVLADARKFDLVAPAYVFGLDAVDTIVTDAAVRPETVDGLRDRDVEVIVAGEPDR